MTYTGTATSGWQVNTSLHSSDIQAQHSVSLLPQLKTWLYKLLLEIIETSNSILQVTTQDQSSEKSAKKKQKLSHILQTFLCFPLYFSALGVKYLTCIYHLKRWISVSHLIVQLPNELQVSFVFKLMIDGLPKHNTLPLLRHQQTQWYCKVVLLQWLHQPTRRLLCVPHLCKIAALHVHKNTFNYLIYLMPKRRKQIINYTRK